MLALKCLILVGIIAPAFAAPKILRIENKPLTIDGGRDAQSGEFPYIASLQRFFGTYKHVCGGVILNETWILTTASCMYTLQSAVVGALNLSNVEPDTQQLDIDQKFLHPDYTDHNPGVNDIALLTLKTPIIFNDNVQPAKLPEQRDIADGIADTAGYGWSPVDLMNILEIVTDLPVISVAECQKTLNDLGHDYKLDRHSNLCSGDLTKASNYCYGDFGNPLIQNGIVIGIVTSFVEPCLPDGAEGAPNIYTNVSNFVDWIQKTMKYN